MTCPCNLKADLSQEQIDGISRGIAEYLYNDIQQPQTLDAGVPIWALGNRNPQLASLANPITLYSNKTIAKTGDSILFTGTYLPNQNLNIFYWVNRTIGPHEHIITVRTDCDGNFKCVGILSSDLHNEQDQPITTSSILRFQACPVGIFPFECSSSSSSDISNEVHITISPGKKLDPSPSSYAKSYPANSTYDGSAIRESIHSEFFRYFSVEDTTLISQERQLTNVLMAIETAFVQQDKKPLNITINYSEDSLKYYYDVVYEYANTKSVKISPTDNTYVNNYASNTNYGTSSSMTVGMLNWLTGPEYHEILMRIPLQDIPPGSTINNADIYMYNTGGIGSSCNLYGIRDIPVANRTWSETDVKWNNKPGYNSIYPNTNFPPCCTQSGGNWYKADITCYVRDMYNKNINLDMDIGFNGATCPGYGGFAPFATTRYSDTSKLPYINVEYTPKIWSAVLPAIPMSYIILGVITVIALALIVWTITNIEEFLAKHPILGAGLGVLLFAGAGILLLSQAGKVKKTLTS